MAQPGAAGARRSRGDATLAPSVVPFDPVGEIRVVDHRAAERAAAADLFAASFGLDEAVEPIEIDGRRTVTITGRGAERGVPIAPAGRRRDRAPLPIYERPGFRGDRAALWAFGLGLLLILAAAGSAHAMVIH